MSNTFLQVFHGGKPIGVCAYHNASDCWYNPIWKTLDEAHSAFSNHARFSECSCSDQVLEWVDIVDPDGAGKPWVLSSRLKACLKCMALMPPPMDEDGSYLEYPDETGVVLDPTPNQKES